MLFGEGNEISFDSTDVPGQTAEYTVKAKIADVIYITFYEDSAGHVVLQRIQMEKDENGEVSYDLSLQRVAAPEANLAFIGWNESAGANDDERIAIEDTNVTLTENKSYYPVYKAAHWITFYSAPAGSGATYVAPAYVLNGQTASDKRPADAAMKWTGYEFIDWYTTEQGEDPEAGTVFNFNQELTEDVTIYAHWRDASAKYTVVYWYQKVTDDVNAADSEKNYDFGEAIEHTVTKGDIISLNDVDTSSFEKEGFSLNTNLSTSSVTVEADGTSVINVYYDRNIYTLAFTVSGNYYQDYVISNGDNGTQYAYVDGEYVQLTRVTHTSTEYFLSENQNGNNEFTGDVFSDQNGTAATRPYDTSKTYYRREWRGIFIIGYYQYYQLYWRSRTVTEYSWELNGEPYLGTRYKYQNTQNHIIRRITALYEQPVSSYFPITSETDGTSYNGYQWSDTGNPQVYDYVLQTVEVMPAANVTFTGTYRGTAKTIYYYVEIIKGEDITGLTTRTFNNKTYKLYKTIQHNFNFLTYEEEYHPIEGYERNHNWAQPAFGNNNQASIGNGNINYLYYNRNSYSLEFIDSKTNDSLGTESVQFEESLSSYEPSTEPESSLPGYKFKGWFKDSACTEPFDFSEKMPASNVPVYAGWEEIWYRVEVDPNGGQLSTGESTFFWLSYGQTIEEYGDITRDYIEDPSGTFYYHYHPYSVVSEDDYNASDYYSKWDRCATYDEVTTTNHYTYNPETGSYELDGAQVEDVLTEDMATKYIYEKGAYALVGWYRVNADGSLGGVYNFGTQITEPITIRAVWRRTGEYSVKYLVDGYEGLADGSVNTENVVPGKQGETAPTDDNSYADNSDTAFLSRIDPPNGYIFTGWYYNGNVCDPGDVFKVMAELASAEGDEKTVYIRPVYTKIENVPVTVSNLTWMPNTVALDSAGTEAVPIPSGVELTVDTDLVDSIVLRDGDVYHILHASVDYDQNEKTITYSDIPLNEDEPIVPAGVYDYRGYKFLGWAKSADATIDQLFLKYENNKYYAKVEGNWVEATAIAADENDPIDTMYAIWQVKTYQVKIVKIIEGTEEDKTNLTFSFSDTNLPETSFVLGDNGTKIFKNVEYGTAFTLTEDISGDAAAFTPSVSCTVTDDDGTKTTTSTENGAEYTVTGNIEITYTNTRNEQPVGFKKVDVDHTDTVLSGAEFTMTDGTNTYTLVSTDGTFYAMSGEIEIQNLPVGTYTITETKAPAGYNLMTGTVELHVEKDRVYWIQTDNNAGASQEAEVDANDNYVVVITNTAGVELPMTGGIGTHINTLSGLVLMAGALMYGFRMRRRERRNE